MIDFRDGVFRLSSKNTSYIFRLTRFGHLEHIYYGARLDKDEPVDPLAFKCTAQVGSSVLYDESDETYCLDTLPLEWSSPGKGDYRHAPMECRMPDGSYVSDFVYESHELLSGAAPAETLPCAHGEGETLRVTLLDAHSKVKLFLYYTLFPECDVLCRRAVLQNDNDEPLHIRRLMSFTFDMPDDGFHLLSLTGGWIREAHKRECELPYGTLVGESTTGASSNRRNPAFALYRSGCTEERGEVYGFNLVYSGNHYSAVERGEGGLIRVMQGVNPHCMDWALKKGECFETPQAVLTFSDAGFNGMRDSFHDFVHAHIIPEYWNDRERPVLYNNWEACFFKFSRGRLLRLAREAKALGAELFVLDDGWFGERNSDNAGLGDYTVNRKKLPGGLSSLSAGINALGMKFGLWFEPEMVNEDSELYRAHPEYAVRVPGRAPARGRHQLALDLTNPEVREYIVSQMRAVLESASIAYVKWDMNRHLSDVFGATLEDQGEFYHRYILGLYELLERIFGDKPEILLESCSSGGNRFDLGMLCYSPQIWASDDTDPIERLSIQSGLSYFYPPSAMGAHVSLAPHQQTLRDTPLNTRFNVSCFSVLGYELDLRFLNRAEKSEIKRQIAYYKLHRKTLQFGRFCVLESENPRLVRWQAAAKDGSELISGLFRRGAEAAEIGPGDTLRLCGLDENAHYTLETRKQPLFLRQFGALVNHLIPVRLHPEGVILRTANYYYTLSDCVERYEGSGKLFMRGVRLNRAYMGTGYNDKTRIMGDYGSNLYLITKE